MRAMRWMGILGVLALVSGCGDDSSLANEEHVRTWATNGSALAVYSRVHEPFAYAFGASTFSDPTCPMRSDDGDTVTITGGCAAEGGHRWSGRATVVRGADDVHTLTLDGYGSYEDPDFRTLSSGTATVRPTGDTTYAFEVTLTADALTETRIEYAGTVEGDYSTATRWNGSGRVTRDGFGEPTGTVSVTTEDEVRDTDVCSNQPASGRTTIEADGDTVVVLYDGATDCDEDKAATWTLNGVDQGRITGIDCAAGGTGRVPTPFVVTITMGALGLVLAARRRRKSAVVTRKRLR